MKHSHIIIISLILCTLAVAFILVYVFTPRNDSAVPSPRSYAEIAASGVLHVATDYSPLTYYAEGDTFTGYDYELLQLICTHAHLQADITPEVSLSKSLEGLDNGTYDVVARRMPVTTENKEKYIFTRPLQLNKQVLVQRLDSTGKAAIRNQLDLGGCTLHIAEDAPTRLRIENLSHEIGDTIYIKEDADYGSEQLIIMVATGEIDYAVCDESDARAIGSTLDGIDYATDISFTQFMAWAVRKEDTQLCDSLNKWIDEAMQSNEYKRLQHKYFGTQ